MPYIRKFPSSNTARFVRRMSINGKASLDGLGVDVGEYRNVKKKSMVGVQWIH
jgi:hypothetical protein